MTALYSILAITKHH